MTAIVHPDTRALLAHNNHPVGRVADLRRVPPDARRILTFLRTRYVREGYLAGHESLRYIARQLDFSPEYARELLATLMAQHLIHRATCREEAYGLCYAERAALIARHRLEQDWLARGRAFYPTGPTGQLTLVQAAMALATGDGPALADAPVPQHHPDRHQAR